jgi:hypothetical protein
MSHLNWSTRDSRRTFTAVGVMLALIAPPAAAQSLGDVARQEQARRGAVKGTGKVYTNDRLRAEPASPAAASPSTPQQATTSPVAAAPAAGAKTPGQPGTAPEGSAAGPKDEKSWRQRMTSLRESAQRNRVLADALQSRINALSADFTARDDPSQRAVIARDRDRALVELGRLKTEIQDQDKAIADAMEEARKAGVPAGWLR